MPQRRDVRLLPTAANARSDTLLLSARAGDQLIGVRAEGNRAMDDLSIVNLGWDDAAQHWFDVNGMRV